MDKTVELALNDGWMAMAMAIWHGKAFSF